MSEEAILYIGLIASAFIAGIMNSIAGGGTLLTFPSLLSAVPAAVANATSTIALLPGSLAGTWAYRNELKESLPFALRMLIPSLLGGLLGAWLVGQDTQQFANLVPWLILTAAVLFLIQQPLSAWMKKHRPNREPGRFTRIGVYVFQFFVAVYGGYFGAGIGILMLTSLGFMGIGDIHRMNSVKTLLASAINGASVIIFIYDDLVNWKYAAVMAVAAILGGYCGARVARRLPANYVRWAVIVIGFGLAVWYFRKHYGG